MYFRLVFFSCFIQLSYSSDCVLHNKSNQEYKTNLLKQLNILNGEKFLDNIGGYTYAFSICSDVSKTHVLAGATRTEISTKKVTVLGRYNDTDIVSQDNGFILTYASGDRITENGTCFGERWKAMILLVCHEGEKLELLEANSAGCLALFQWKNEVLCPQTGWSAFSIFCTLFLFSFVIYLLLGTIYRRLILGAKGFEQVPHYLLWKRILLMPLTILEKILGRDNQEVVPQRTTLSNQSDPADEPLLSP